ncbi:MAG: cobalamin B12-binding domain-containing protein [Myxococcota bacterium]|nr:cobalamin B12-binding domain-containing protein [Myxococcales bacterium]
MSRRIRVLLAKLGLDSHTIGVTVIARALRDAGIEVVYTGLKQTPESVVAAAIQEDVDVVGLSSLSAAHMQHFPRVVELLRAQGGGDKLLIAGGVIPDEDAERLREIGFARIFTMGADSREIVDYIRGWAESQASRAS